MTDKLKNEQRIGRMTFFVAWVVIAVIAEVIMKLMITTAVDLFDIGTGSTLWVLAIFIIYLVVYAVVGILQMMTMYRMWGFLLRDWLWVTAGTFAVGNLMSQLFLDFMMTHPDIRLAPYGVNLLFIVPPVINFGLVGMAQAWLLKAHFKYVWLYVLVSIPVGLVSGYNIAVGISIVGSLSVALYGVGTGLLLLWLDHITYEDTGDEMSIAEAQT